RRHGAHLLERGPRRGGRRRGSPRRRGPGRRDPRPRLRPGRAADRRGPRPPRRGGAPAPRRPRGARQQHGVPRPPPPRVPGRALAAPLLRAVRVRRRGLLRRRLPLLPADGAEGAGGPHPAPPALAVEGLPARARPPRRLHGLPLELPHRDEPRAAAAEVARGRGGAPRGRRGGRLVNLALCKSLDRAAGAVLSPGFRAMDGLSALVRPDPPPLSAVRAILVTKLWGIGNWALLRPVVRDLRARWPSARFLALTLEANLPLVEDLFDRVLVVRPRSLVRVAWGLLSALRALERERPEVSLDFEQFSAAGAL